MAKAQSIMVKLLIVDKEVEAAPSGVTSSSPTDRRRIGRLKTVSPRLIPLLRNAASHGESDVNIESESSHEGAAAKGIAIGLTLVSPFWAALGYFLFRIL